MVSPRYPPEYARLTFFYQAYIYLKIPKTVTPPAPADTKTIPFNKGQASLLETLIVEGDYGSVNLCGYFDSGTVKMIDCDQFVYPVKVVTCQISSGN